MPKSVYLKSSEWRRISNSTSSVICVTFGSPSI